MGYFASAVVITAGHYACTFLVAFAVRSIGAGVDR
jgi:hypothetical protein